MKAKEIKIKPELLHLDKVIDFFDNIIDVVHLPSDKSGKIDYDNLKKLISELKFTPNIYAFYIKENKSKAWHLKYIGQRSSKEFKNRMREHFSKHHEKTGSKLKQINAAIKEGKDIGVKFLGVQPEGLRKYYEEELINHFHKDLEWNDQKGKGKSTKRKK
ncbi:MAG: hypothetical protein IM600_03720 [Bacteroidetes bacterium]|nr:hypothetical protein [Bacteroidota bacterium]MCA6442517.1 hypothetical protein [Bacteroidota bacterium]